MSKATITPKDAIFGSEYFVSRIFHIAKNMNGSEIDNQGRNENPKTTKHQAAIEIVILRFLIPTFLEAKYNPIPKILKANIKPSLV